MARIFISIPILGKPEMRMMQSLYGACLSTKKHQVRLHFNENDSLISRVRNVHMSVFYHEFKECDYFMSIDSDIEILNAHPTNNIFDKLIEHDLDFVGGLYSIKKPGVIRCSSIPIPENRPMPFNSGLAEMRWLSSGCWCIKREAVEKMVNAYPELEYDGDDNVTNKKIHGLYIPILHDLKPEDHPGLDRVYRKYLSEDWSFCERWRALGGQIWADTSIILKHIGKQDYNLYNVEMVVKQGTPPQAGSVPQRPQPQGTPQPPQPGFDLKGTQ